MVKFGLFEFELDNLIEWMKQRKLIEIAIYPKIFTVLSFYSKGQYTVSISIKQELKDGTYAYAFPVIIQKKDMSVHESKKPQIKVDDFEHSFLTEQ